MTSVHPKPRNGRSAALTLDEIVALGYRRVSTDEQATDGGSLHAQELEIRRYILRETERGWIAGETFEDVLSGRKDHRPEYQRLLLTIRRLALEGRRVVVVVAALDRLGRNVRERVRAYEELKSLGVNIHSVREGGVVDELTYNILASVAQEESRKIQERTRRQNAFYAATGWHKPGSMAWGYVLRARTEDEQKAGAPLSVPMIDETTEPYVREAWERFAQGQSMRKVASWAAGLPEVARGGRNLGYNAIRKLLRAPVYVARVGEYDDDDPDAVLARPKARWPALIDDETWRRATRQHRQAERMPKQASGAYPLTGLIRCPRCVDSRMSGRLKGSQGGRRAPRREYICHGGLTLGAANDGSRCLFTVHADVIEARVLATVESMLRAATEPAMRSRIVKEWDRRMALRSNDRAVRRIAVLEAEQAKTKKRSAEASVKYLDGKLDDDDYQGVREHLRAEAAAIVEELDRLRGSVRTVGLPRIDTFLAGLTGWADAIREAEPGRLRGALGDLIAWVKPIRIGRGAYEASIEPTAAGRWLLWAALAIGPEDDNLVSVDHSGKTRLSTQTIPGVA